MQPEYVYVLQSLGLSYLEGARLWVDADGMSEVAVIHDLACVKGLDKEEPIKVAAKEMMRLTLYSPADVSAYQWRHGILALKPTTSLKLRMGVELTPEDRRLAEKYGLEALLAAKPPKPLDLQMGVEETREAVARLSASGVAARIVPPRGYKVVLLGVSAERPAGPARCYLKVERDDVDVMSLDLYCLPSLPNAATVRVVALERLEASLDVRTSGTYKVRLVYGIGRLTVQEKIMWNIPLTAEERRVAEEQDLFDRVAAGVA